MSSRDQPPARFHVRASVTDDLRAIATQVIATVREEIPSYEHLQIDQVADIENIAAWSLGRLLDVWTGSGEVEPLDRTRMRNIGAARARDGRPIGAIVHAYRVGSGHFIEHVARTHQADLDVIDIADLSIAVLNVLDEVTDAITEGYATAREQLQIHADDARADLLGDMLTGRRSTGAALHDRCRQLGLRLHTHPDLLVVQPSHGAAISSLDSSETDSPWPDSWASTMLSTTHNGREVHLLPPGHNHTLEQICEARKWRGCVISAAPISATARSYRLAIEAIDNAPDHAYTGRALLNLGDAHLLALLAARPTADPAEAAQELLGPLTDTRNRHLLAALAAYLATGTATQAANQLHLHAQTLRYRLRRALELTGRDPQLPWHRLALSIAVHLLDLSVGTVSAERESSLQPPRNDQAV